MLSDDDESFFEYVVERPPPAPVCFGSKMHRDTNPVGKGLSPYQRLEAPEILDVGPGSYDSGRNRGALEGVLGKVRSKKGFPPLASEAMRFQEKRFMRTPSPTRYNPGGGLGGMGEVLAPFGSKTARITMKGDSLPGPGSYDLRMRKCRRTRFSYNFGRPCMISTIEIICVSKPSDTCLKCEQLCRGDYWQKEHTFFLCHLCWEEEMRIHEVYPLQELKEFKKIRNCCFAHEHEGTQAAIRLLHPKKIKKKLRLENYLDLYIKC